MSIIYEALKKTQARLSNPDKEKKGKNYLMGFGIGFVFLGFLGCGFALMLLINASSQKTLAKYIEPQNASKLKSAALTSAVAPRPGSSELILNGIITMEGENLALINNQILKEGDYILDKRIISITKDKVELYSKGKLLVLIQK